mmetsp:Transcript_6404/g.15448  ORF Transcript_6404/g.15448 Transcript_6404/m.15448 type:complete len:293 (+) Transcript_6404:435-1313(+)
MPSPCRSVWLASFLALRYRQLACWRLSCLSVCLSLPFVSRAPSPSPTPMECNAGSQSVCLSVHSLTRHPYIHPRHDEQAHPAQTWPQPMQSTATLLAVVCRLCLSVSVSVSLSPCPTERPTDRTHAHALTTMPPRQPASQPAIRTYSVRLTYVLHDVLYTHGTPHTATANAPPQPSLPTPLLSISPSVCQATSGMRLRFWPTCRLPPLCRCSRAAGSCRPAPWCSHRDSGGCRAGCRSGCPGSRGSCGAGGSCAPSGRGKRPRRPHRPRLPMERKASMATSGWTGGAGGRRP